MGKLTTAFALLTLLSAGQAWANGCYTCGNGSQPSCQDYCRYEGPDTFDNRHKCQHKGCHITGTSACPNAHTANVHMCLAPASSPAPETLAAAPLWCVNRSS